MAGLTETATRNLKAELARHDRAVNNRLKGHTPLSTDEIEKAASMLDMEPENLVMLLIQPIDSIKQFKV